MSILFVSTSCPHRLLCCRIASDNAHLLLAASAPPAHQSAANATASAAAPTTAGSGGGGGGGGGNGGLIKPKLIRQAAILADVDSTGSGKSVTFADPPPPTKTAVCPVHSAEYAAILGSRYRSLYNKLVESNQVRNYITTFEQLS